MTPKISLIGPAHRTELWLGFYKNIITSVPFEVVFVSDKKSDFELPQNFKYIYSTVKPAQCFEIAYRNSTGENILWCGDDLTYSPNSFEYLLEEQTDYKHMVFCRYFEDNHEATQNQTTWDQKFNLTATGLISRKAIEEAGGLGDINFVCGLWDCDLIMRIYALGGKSHYCQRALCNEPHLELHKKEANFATTWEWEDKFFRSLWSDAQGNACLIRKQPFQGYSEKDILTVSQGNRGKWA